MQRKSMLQHIRTISGLAWCAMTCLALGTLLIPSAQAQRLPDTVRPEHYGLTLTPDIKNAIFTGSETIDVQVLKPVDSITLNAAEIKFQSVKTKLKGKTLEAAVTEDTDKQQVTFNFHQQLPAGK